MYNGILLSHKKECIWVSSNKMDEPKAYYTEWSKSEENRYHILMHIFWMAQMVKKLPTVWETWVWSLGREDPLEKGMATHSSILAWKIPWTEEPGELQSMGLQRIGHDWVTNTFSFSGDTDIENRLVDTGRGKVESGMNGESSRETYTLPYVK